LFQAKQALPISQRAGSIQTLGRIVSAEVEQAQTNAIGLFGMVLYVQLAADPGQDIGADILRPVFKSPRGPLMVFLVALGHVGRLGGGAGIALTGMGSNGFAGGSTD
jgi:hypothetical protein